MGILTHLSMHHDVFDVTYLSIKYSNIPSIIKYLINYIQVIPPRAWKPRKTPITIKCEGIENEDLPNVWNQTVETWKLKNQNVAYLYHMRPNREFTIGEYQAMATKR